MESRGRALGKACREELCAPRARGGLGGDVSHPPGPKCFPSGWYDEPHKAAFCLILGWLRAVQSHEPAGLARLGSPAPNFPLEQHLSRDAARNCPTDCLCPHGGVLMGLLLMDPGVGHRQVTAMGLPGAECLQKALFLALLEHRAWAEVVTGMGEDLPLRGCGRQPSLADSVSLLLRLSSSP